MAAIVRLIFTVVFFLGFFTALMSQFTEQLTYPEVLIHIAIITLVYFGLMFPPDELCDGIGISLYNIFSSFFPPENYKFVEYCWMRQVCFTFVWQLFPGVLGCYFFHGQLYMVNQNESRFPYYFDFPVAWIGCFLLTAALLILEHYLTIRYKADQFLRYFHENPGCEEDVEEMVADPDTFKIGFSNHAKLYCNAEYFVYASNFRLVARRQADVVLQVDNTRMPLIGRNNNEEPLRHIYIRVTFRDPRWKPFTLSLRHDLFRHLNEILPVPIVVPAHIVIPLTIMEELKEDFVARIEQNDRHAVRMKAEERESCFACGSEENMITIVKTCADNNERWQFSMAGARVYTDQCEICRCRPLWCNRCIAQIFISKQNIDSHYRHDYWRGTAKCPTCRKVFCIRDVHLVDYDIEEEAEQQPAPVEN